ncbi:hypothetical protein [Thermofilum pendens]|uniref:Neutral/alkaline non-lysosomal ceramidase N-terminal domain-containing protein n=1 Tax=Thermofilum pendens (strain DSM 2475 / Hrk 5) TaxID=368408 RepID=A1RZ64_THEPD|nr:hypothetical protein [Thermofilum pendens]ABL78494.1 hypothetical protein Tpen_1095 [Thermofilum pendens Hrk 5]
MAAIGVALGAVPITPSPPAGHELAGYIARQGRSLGAHDDVEARCMLIDWQPAVLLVNLDLLGVDSGIVETVHRVAEREVGAVEVVVSATHTHSAPATLFTNPLLTFGGSFLRRDYLAYFEERLRILFQDLAGRVERHDVLVGKGSVSGVVTDREDPGRKVDDEALVVVFKRGLQTAGYLLNYAVHPTVLGPDNLLISKDLVDPVLRYLGAAWKAGVGLFLNGAAANVSTRFTRRGQTFEEAERLGKLLVDQLLLLPLRGMPGDAAEVDLQAKRVSVSFRQPSPEELSAALRVGAGSAHPRVREAILEGVKALERITPYLSSAGRSEVELRVLRIGSLRLLFAPFELHSDFSLRLKRFAGSGKLGLVGYSGEYLGYLVPRDYALGYESVMQVLDEESSERVLRGLEEVLDFDPLPA